MAAHTSSLHGKVALVTGCGSAGPGWGNGKAIASLLAREGAQVFGCDVRHEAALETQELVASEGGDITVSAYDVSRAEQVESLVHDCVARYGRVDVLVNNVGIVNLGGVAECALEDWDRALAVNLTSMFLTCKYVVPHMLAQGGGSMVHIGSVAGIRDSGVPYVAYSTTKAATLGLSRSVALQYAKHNIRSNVVLPGLMDTPMIVEPLRTSYGAGSIAAMREKRNGQCPMGHMGSAWDVAHAVLWLASAAAGYVTGAELVVDGGITAKFA